MYPCLPLMADIIRRVLLSLFKKYINQPSFKVCASLHEIMYSIFTFSYACQSSTLLLWHTSLHWCQKHKYKIIFFFCRKPCKVDFLLQIPAYSKILDVTPPQLSAPTNSFWVDNPQSWKITIIWCIISFLLSSRSIEIAQFCSTRRDEQSWQEDWILDGSLAQLHNLLWA